MSSGAELAIRTDRLGKRYDLGSAASYRQLRDVIARVFRASVDRLRARRPGVVDDEASGHWALRDVSFDVRHGEVVGIIGRNGSGKSTLLKILSRITEPTAGSATVRGRVGSLLEVGTGFHPELTGRENIFVNGAILGMRRVDITRRFDEIVAFASVEKYLDTAVKYYSSGMQMRLAFAVAAHLDPHILIVDEVLAVGDAEFQRRCLGKMQEVSREGRTVLLVSHQMGQIRRLCETVLWLDSGRVRAWGGASDTVHAYETALMSPTPDAPSGLCFQGWELSGGGHTLSDTSTPITIQVHLTGRSPVANGHLSVTLLNQHDDVVAGWAFEPLALDAGVDRLDVTVATLPVRPGPYRLVFALYENGSNLTGGRLVEKWVGTPELGIDVMPLGHPQDLLAGVLNVAATLRVPPGADSGRRDGAAAGTTLASAGR